MITYLLVDLEEKPCNQKNFMILKVGKSIKGKYSSFEYNIKHSCGINSFHARFPSYSIFLINDIVLLFFWKIFYWEIFGKIWI